MKTYKSDRGFINLIHPAYVDSNDKAIIIGESSAIGDYIDSMENPGSSFLWVGDKHHLNREQVRYLIKQMQHWIDNKRLII